MSTLKKTIRLQSSDLFPTSIDFTVVKNEVIGGQHSSFQSIDVPANSSITLFETDESVGNGGVLYVYLQSNATNPNTALELSITNKTNNKFSFFSRLFPGDIATLPLYANDENGIELTVKNLNPTDAANLYFFAGEKN